MKKISRTLILLVGITANLVLACSGPEDKSSKEPYPASDTLHEMESKNDADTVPSSLGGRSNGIDQATE
jgi:hypothetical protein